MLTIGEVISWTARECARSDLRAACLSVGASSSMPDEVTPWATAAARGIAATTGARSDFVAARLRPQPGESARWHVATRRRETDRADYQSAGLVIVRDGEAGAVYVGGVPSAVSRSIERERYTASAGEVSETVVSVIDGGAAGLVPLRERGGAYFVPRDYRAAVDRAAEILGRCGGRMLRFSVGESDRASAAEAIATHVESLAAQLAAEVAELSREGAIAARAQRINELRAYIGAHSTVLADLAARCEAALRAAESDITRALAGAKGAA
jgi:hypothetical protein